MTITNVKTVITAVIDNDIWVCDTKTLKLSKNGELIIVKSVEDVFLKLAYSGMSRMYAAAYAGAIECYAS
jgi:hypothetical protein